MREKIGMERFRDIERGFKTMLKEKNKSVSCNGLYEKLVVVHLPFFSILLRPNQFKNEG